MIKRRKKILPKTVTTEQVAEMKKHITKERDRLAVDLLLHTGMRISELVGITWEDVGEWTRENNTWNMAKPKKSLLIRSEIAKNRRERVIPLNDNARRVIEALKADLINAGRAPIPSHAVVQGKIPGKHLSKRQFQRIISKASKQAGITINVTPHKFRHTFATNLLNANIDIRTLQELLGHENLNTTQIYTHVSEEKMRMAVKKLEKKE